MSLDRVQPAGRQSGSPPAAFRSATVDRIRQCGNVMELPGAQILLPNVFGFCRGVERALEMLDAAVNSHAASAGKLFLLGEIIHNPWVNNYFHDRGVTILSPTERAEAEKHLTSADCAVIPAFGVPVAIRKRLQTIGCRIVDTSCGDVRRLWKWAEQAAGEGYGVLIFGRAMHDETVVTKSRLSEVGGVYLVLGDLAEVGQFCDLITGQRPARLFGELFGPEATNAPDLSPLERLAQVSQTTMLYQETLKVRQALHEAFRRRFGRRQLDKRLCFQPTVCRATQARQSAAVELCRKGCDLTIVVGGFGSSNTRHLFELASEYGPAYFIESAEAIYSGTQLATCDFASGRTFIATDWLPDRRPLRIALLAGASSPEIVVGLVLEKLATILS